MREVNFINQFMNSLFLIFIIRQPLRLKVPKPPTKASLNINSIWEISPVIKLNNDTENIKIETWYFCSNKQNHKNS